MQSRLKQSGSALIWTLCVITILSVLAAELLRMMSTKYHNAIHTATWQESLLAAESGIDVAIAELRKTLYPAPNHAWEGWSNRPANGVTSYGITTVPNAGLASTPMTIEVNVDAPNELRDAANSWQYYRIRAIGTMPVIGPARASDNKQDTRLRKMSLRTERFAGTTFAAANFNGPQLSRRIEAIVRPVSAFDLAIMSVGQLDLTDQNIVIDSYDSRDPRKSTNGLYPNQNNPPALDTNADDGSVKRQQNGDIATDGTIINAGNARVFGDVATNSGTVTGVANVTGLQRNDFYQDPIPVAAPAWGSVFNPSPVSVGTTAVLQASSAAGARKAYAEEALDPSEVPDAAASRYILNSVTLAGNQTLTLANPTITPAKPNGDPAYIVLYVTGTVDVTGQGQVILAPGVKAKIYFAGNFKIAGNGVVNTNNQPGDLLFYGITPLDNSPRTFELGGNSMLSAAVNAPAFDVQINNGGTRGSVYGSFVGKTVKMNGVTDLHYDEALGGVGTPNNYKIVSWVEDTR
jgi:hypothetical protein